MTPQRRIHHTLTTRPVASRTSGVIPVGTMASGAAFGIPFLVLKGAHSGKTLWINGQVHGVEVTGILSALDFANGLDLSHMRGNVVITTTANPPGLDARQKNAPQDNNDLDQTFPGRADGFFSERIAYALFEEIRGIPDLLINMHAQGPQVITRSYAVYKDHPNGNVRPEDLFPYIAAFDPHVTCRMRLEPGQGELLGHIEGALDYQLLAIGIPSFMIELGVGQRAQASDVALGLRGLREVAMRMGILEGKPQERASLLRVTQRGHATVQHGGFFRPSRKPGDIVRAGEAFGETLNVFGEVVERPSLARDAIVSAIRVDPVVHSGDRFGYLAYAWEDIQLL